MESSGCRRQCTRWSVLVIGLLAVGCQLPDQRAGLSGESAYDVESAKRASSTMPGSNASLLRVSHSTSDNAGSQGAAEQLDMPRPLPMAPGATPSTLPMPGHEDGSGAGSEPVPVELNKVSLPPYVIEPPDILLIDTVRMIPLPPYRVEPLDVLLIQAAEPLPNQIIAGPYGVGPDGTINLGYSYGLVRVAGLTLAEVEAVLRAHLSRTLRNPQVSVALATYRGIQQVRGEHLVTPDGTINLGTYGAVYVAGLTLPQARCVIEKYLSQFVLNPQISLSVFAYNSKVYYVIFDGGGFGQQVLRFPITGNETVLDAISNVAGLPAVASKKRLWLARPAPAGHPCDQILPIDWLAITQGGSTATNYQLFPGDRIYVKADCLISLDYALAKILSPIERIFGVTLLGEATVQGFRNNNNGFNNGVPFIP
jgi:protein involved in polysaccharide export with SLBB domain